MGETPRWVAESTATNQPKASEQIFRREFSCAKCGKRGVSTIRIPADVEITAELQQQIEIDHDFCIRKAKEDCPNCRRKENNG